MTTTTAPTARQELVWCETHNPRGTAINRGNRHPMTAECVWPCFAGYADDPTEDDRWVPSMSAAETLDPREAVNTR